MCTVEREIDREGERERDDSLYEVYGFFDIDEPNQLKNGFWTFNSVALSYFILNVFVESSSKKLYLTIALYKALPIVLH